MLCRCQHTFAVHAVQPLNPQLFFLFLPLPLPLPLSPFAFRPDTLLHNQRHQLARETKSRDPNTKNNISVLHPSLHDNTQKPLYSSWSDAAQTHKYRQHSLPYSHRRYSLTAPPSLLRCAPCLLVSSQRGPLRHDPLRIHAGSRKRRGRASSERYQRSRMDEASAHSEESFADLLRVRPNLETGRRPRPARRLARLLDALALEVRVQEPWWQSRVSKRIS